MYFVAANSSGTCGRRLIAVKATKCFVAATVFFALLAAAAASAATVSYSSSSSLLCLPLLLLLLLRCHVVRRPSSPQALYFVAANSCGTAKVYKPLRTYYVAAAVTKHVCITPSVKLSALYFVVANEYINTVVVIIFFLYKVFFLEKVERRQL